MSDYLKDYGINKKSGNFKVLLKFQTIVITQFLLILMM